MWGVSRRRKLQLVSAVVAVLAVVGGGAAYAASKAFSPSEESQAVINDAAKQLGVTPAQLSDALKTALKNRVDDAVSSGRLTKDQGDALKKRIDSGNVPFPFGFFGRGAGPDLKHGFGPPFAKFDAAASYLGLGESELETQLGQGKTLAQIAKDRGKSVDGLIDALVAAAEKKIDTAVADGKLTKAQADGLKTGLRDRMTRVVNGEDFGFRRFRLPNSGFDFRRPDFFRRPGFGHGFRARPARSA
jgi:hypothetical protein